LLPLTADQKKKNSNQGFFYFLFFGPVIYPNTTSSKTKQLEREI
jgi:hypothetical protein